MPALDDDGCRTATSVALEVAGAIADPIRLSSAIERTQRQADRLRTPGWSGYTVARGYAGLGAMCAYFDACFPGTGWDSTAHQFLRNAATDAERLPSVVPGLFDGIGGLAFAALLLSRGGSRYERLRSALDPVLVCAPTGLAEQVHAATDGLPTACVDVISGLSGLGAYLLRCTPPGDDITLALRTVSTALVELAQGGSEVPRWWAPPALAPDRALPRRFAARHLNCGLAHGIPGPLSFLALALRAGTEVPGQADAVRSLAGWLAEHRLDDEWGVNWPDVIPVDSPAAESQPPARSAWCYGSPGVARALWLAGEALEDRSFRNLAVEAMAAVYRRPVQERRIDSPTFCHGVAGLLQVTLRFLHDTGLAMFADAATRLTDQLLDAHQRDSLLGYRSLDPDGTRVDRPGLLDGAAGVAVVLLAAASDVEPEWDGLFLLA
jgi:lantibiotic biosynthesis protein